jgi:transcriptional regulator with XRE-family HTH domain
MFAESDLSQDQLAELLGVHKGLISKRLKGSENLTVKTLSQMGTAMKHRLIVSYQPYDSVGTSNYYMPTLAHPEPSTTTNSQGLTQSFGVTTSANSSSVQGVIVTRVGNTESRKRERL